MHRNRGACSRSQSWLQAEVGTYAHAPATGVNVHTVNYQNTEHATSGCTIAGATASLSTATAGETMRFFSDPKLYYEDLSICLQLSA